MTHSDYIDRAITEEEIDLIAPLYSAAFKKNPEIPVFRWKYFQNPSGTAVWRGIFAGAELVAAGAMIPEYFSVYGERRKLYKCTDLMVHPNHQRRGLAKGVIKSLNEQIQQESPIISYTLCAKHATPGFVRNHFIHCDPITNYFKPRFMLVVGSLFRNAKHLYAEGIIRRESNPKELFQAFDFQQDPSRIQFLKSADLLTWRTTHPRYSYEVIFHFDGNTPDGYLILGKTRGGMLNIIDLEANGHDMRVLKDLIIAAEYEAIRHRSRAITGCAVRGTRFANLMATQHFLRNPFEQGPLRSLIDFNVCIDESYGPELFKKENWEIYALVYDDL